MARISKSQVHAALDIAAQHILNARGDDNVISRLDIRQKLRELSGTERNLVDMLYRFIDKRDYKPGARVTKTDVEDTLAYTKVKLINAYDENNNGFSRAEIEKMSTTGKLAVSFARELKARENETTLLQELRILGEGLYFIGWGSEHDPYLRYFHLPANLETLSQENFLNAMGLNPEDPAQSIAIWEQGVEEYGRMFETYEYYDAWEDLAKFRRLNDFMTANLRDVTHVIIGEDGLREDSQYPTYFVGLTPSGDIAGFETEMIWT